MVWSLLFILRLPQSSACFGELVCNVSASVTGLTEFEIQWTKQLDQGAHTNRKAKKLQILQTERQGESWKKFPVPTFEELQPLQKFAISLSISFSDPQFLKSTKQFTKNVQAVSSLCTLQMMSSDLLILGSEDKTTMAVSEGLKSLAGYPLQLIKANFIAFGWSDVIYVWDCLLFHRYPNRRFVDGDYYWNKGQPAMMNFSEIRLKQNDYTKAHELLELVYMDQQISNTDASDISTDSSLNSSDTEEHGWESDRSWKYY